VSKASFASDADIASGKQARFIRTQVMKHTIQLLKPAGQVPMPAEKGALVLCVRAPNAEKPDYYYLYPEEWVIKPDDLDKVTRNVSTPVINKPLLNAALISATCNTVDI
jgi:hypothetical protein